MTGQIPAKRHQGEIGEMLTAIASTQNVHRQPIDCEMKPPAMGPRLGPSVGPKANIPIATPRFSLGMMSAIVPPPMVSGAEPATPARSLNARNMPVSVLVAQAMVKAKNTALQT